MKKLLFFLTLVFAVMGIIVLSALLESETPLPQPQSSVSALQN